MAQQDDVFKKIVSHCKEYGFVFPSSDIYDGLGAVYDYGQNGVEMKNNIKQYWWQSMVLLHDNIVGIDSAIFMHPTIWKASGHVDAFNDPLIDNRDSKKRYRADVLIEEQMAKYEDKVNKEVEKARKKFGEAFDEAEFRNTNPRVLENQKKFDNLHARYSAWEGDEAGEAEARRLGFDVTHVVWDGSGNCPYQTSPARSAHRGSTPRRPTSAPSARRRRRSPFGTAGTARSTDAAAAARAISALT